MSDKIIVKCKDGDAAQARNADGELYFDLWKISHANVARVATKANEYRAALAAAQARIVKLEEELNLREQKTVTSREGANMNMTEVSKTLDRFFAEYKKESIQYLREYILRDFFKLCDVFGLNWEEEFANRSRLYWEKEYSNKRK